MAKEFLLFVTKDLLAVALFSIVMMAVHGYRAYDYLTMHNMETGDMHADKMSKWHKVFRIAMYSAMLLSALGLWAFGPDI